MTNFVAIKPVPITGARLTSSSVNEPAIATEADPPEWGAGNAYTLGQRVTRTVVHKIYQRLIAGTTAGLPEADTVNWILVGSTNRWRMFDTANNTQTAAAEQIIVTLTPNDFADSLVVLNAEAALINLSIADTDYNVSQGMESRIAVNWYQYFFARVESGRTEFVFENIPLRLGNVLTLTVSRPGKIARIGTCILGLSKVLGSTEYGASAGISDYSKKDTDTFGNTTIVPRAFSKRMNVSLVTMAKEVDGVHRFLTLNRSQPLVFVGAQNEYSTLIIYGFFKSFEVVIAFLTHSKCSLDVEGLI